MFITAKSLASSLFALSLSALFAFSPSASAKNIFEDFSKAPTFTPPDGCIPLDQNYGVVSYCKKTIEPGHNFAVVIDVAVGWMKSGDSRNSTIFVTDQVAEIKTYWQEKNLRNLVFSSRASDVTPANAPPQGTVCLEYSIAADTEEVMNGRPVPIVEHIEGLTCAWPVEAAAAGKPNVEIFWLEASDVYAPSIGQKPMESFDSTVRKLFASARL
jgi:hypothetical protein